MSHLQQGTVYSLIKCVYEYTVVEWPHTSDEYHALAPWDLVAATMHEYCVSIGPTSGG